MNVMKNLMNTSSYIFRHSTFDYLRHKLLGVNAKLCSEIQPFT